MIGLRYDMHILHICRQTVSGTLPLHIKQIVCNIFDNFFIYTNRVGLESVTEFYYDAKIYVKCIDDIDDKLG